MFTDSMELGDTIAKIYKRIGFGGTSSSWKSVSSDLDDTDTLRISHATNKPAKATPGFVVTRSLFSLAKTRFVESKQANDVAVLNLTLSRPSSGTITANDLDGLRQQLVSLVTNVNLWGQFVTAEI